MAADAGAGLPDGHALRGATIAVRVAEVAQADDKTVREAFYLPLLAMSGCTAESHTSAEALGDEVAIGVETYGLDWGRASEMLPAVLRLARRGRGPIGGAVSMARAMGKLTQMMDVGRAHCEVAIHLAGRFGFDESFRMLRGERRQPWSGARLRVWSVQHLESRSLRAGGNVPRRLVLCSGPRGHRVSLPARSGSDPVRPDELRRWVGMLLGQASEDRSLSLLLPGR
jgi:hypothetical protein